MAKIQTTINKSEMIRDYKAEHPHAKPKEIAEALSEQTGETFSNGQVSTVLNQAKKKGQTSQHGREARPGYVPVVPRGEETGSVVIMGGKPDNQPTYSKPGSVTEAYKLAAKLVALVGVEEATAIVKDIPELMETLRGA